LDFVIIFGVNKRRTISPLLSLSLWEDVFGGFQFFVEMKMMGIVMIDGASARLDGLVEVASDFYYRRMTLVSDLPKAGATPRETKRALSVDPPVRKELSMPLLINSSLLYGRQVIICVQNGQRFFNFENSS